MRGATVTPKRQIATAVGAGLLAGFLILGIGGRVAMRVVAYTTTEPPRFTPAGTLQIVAFGMMWGGITGPLLLLLVRPPRGYHPWTGPVFGMIVLSLALLAVGASVGFGGRIVAPPAFIALSAVVFPLLFVLHGVATTWLVARWIRGGRRT